MKRLTEMLLAGILLFLLFFCFVNVAFFFLGFYFFFIMVVFGFVFC